MKEVKLERSVSLTGAIAITVGSVIGMSLFVLIGDMSSLTGPSLPLAFFFALIPALFNAITVSQLGSAMPRSGGGYVFTSRILTPFWGYVTSWFIILAIIGALATVSIGIAQYVHTYLPDQADTTVIAIIIVTAFVLVNIFGLVIAETVQIIMVFQMLCALVLFVIFGIYFTPEAVEVAPTFLLEGWGGLALASVLCYYSYVGFAVIAELGEEMKRPKKNIPLSIGISAVIIFLMYAVISVIFNRVIAGYGGDVSEIEAPLAYAGGLFLPTWAWHFLNLGALGAALTSINAGIIAMPREMYAQGRDRMLPRVFHYVTKKRKTPVWAILAILPGVIVLLLFRLGEDFYGFLAVTALLITNITIALACIKLPKKYPKQYEKAPFKISRGWLLAISWGAIITSAIFLGFILLQALMGGESAFVLLLSIIVCWGILTGVFFMIGKKKLERKGVDFKKLFSRLPGYEEE
jgi:APA family basic amino acid/polyamine antiporter